MKGGCGVLLEVPARRADPHPNPLPHAGEGEGEGEEVCASASKQVHRRE